jgi:hypothetical protein
LVDVGFKSKAVRSGGQDAREKERDRHKIEHLLFGVGATNFGRPYKLGIYTPKLGDKPFQHIIYMARPLMDNVNTAIRYPHSTLPHNGSVPKIRKNERKKYTSFTDLKRG